MNDTKATYSGVLGQVLANLRRSQGIDQEVMALKMGLTQASYSRLESGKASFSIDQMYQASNALGVSSVKIIEMLNNYASHLNLDGIKVEAHVRSNTTKATQSQVKNSDVGTFVAGAALGALLLGILSNK